jgi:small-conductance mechanosensitive channel
MLRGRQQCWSIVLTAVRVLPFLLAVLIAVTVAGRGAAAQDMTALDVANKQIAATRTAIDQIASALSGASLTASLLNDRRAAIETLRLETLAPIPKLLSSISDLEARLRRIGPTTDEAPSDALVGQRASITSLLDRFRGAKDQLSVLSVEIDQLAARASRLQRDLFFQQVFEPSRSIVNPALWLEGASAFYLVADRLRALFDLWLSEATTKLSGPTLAAIFGGIAALLMFALLFGRYLARRFEPALRMRTPSNFDRLWRVIRLLVVTILVISFFIVGTWSILRSVEILTPRFGGLLSALFTFLMNFSVLQVVAWTVLSPRLPAWRLPRLDDVAAGRIYRLATAGAVIFALDEMNSGIVNLLFLPLTFSVGQSAIVTIGMILLIIGIWRAAEANTLTLADPAERRGSRRYYFGWIGRLKPLLWLLLAVAVLALIFGYVSLGHFITIAIVSTLTLISFFYILRQLVDEVVTEATKPASVVGRFLRQQLSLSDRGVERLGVVFASMADLVLFLIAIPIVFFQWTLNWIDLRGWLSGALFGFEVAGRTIYPSTLFIALCVLLLGIGLTNIFTSWVDRRVLMRTHIDKGVRDSIRKGVNYVGVILATILALTAAGVDFSDIAIIAGALGVGIGFGLQSIVNNFVSGLVLLAERPIKVGDWIVVAAGEGFVSRINVRSTEIDTFDRATIIIPNSNLISEPVKNWTHGNTTGKSIIKVRVAYDSDADAVRDILLGCAKAHPDVARDPEPFVQLVEFGDNTLDFLLHFYIDDVLTGAMVSSDLRFAILNAFRNAGIRIPALLREVPMDREAVRTDRRKGK